jgi:hypothetical protein
MSDPTVKTYCINFSLSADLNLAAFVQYLFDSADVLAFWNYIPLVYCVKSRLNATQLTQKLQAFFPPSSNFMVVEIKPYNMNGRLMQEAWNWFYLDHHVKSHLLSATSAAVRRT